ncbi:hypothetical protein DFH27DRAFT_572642 [Peziza echinospora]|nr:hypothetical protein DFH27DRAFT_572642 [Peziza echinospora]
MFFFSFSSLFLFFFHFPCSQVFSRSHHRCTVLVGTAQISRVGLPKLGCASQTDVHVCTKSTSQQPISPPPQLQRPGSHEHCDSAGRQA